MQTQKLQKKQAIALLAILYTGRYKGNHEHDLQMAAERKLPLLVSDGCKVYAEKRGCVVSYRISGYAHDGSDVANALKRIS